MRICMYIFFNLYVCTSVGQCVRMVIIGACIYYFFIFNFFFVFQLWNESMRCFAIYWTTGAHAHIPTHTHSWFFCCVFVYVYRVFIWHFAGLTWNAVNCTMNANDMMVIFFKMRHFSPGFKMTFSLSDAVSGSKPAFGCK